MEVWKDIPGYEGRYQVSDMGQVKSLPRGTRRNRVERLLKPMKARGYQRVRLYKEGKRRDESVHVLVATAFLGPKPKGDIEVRHLDGNRCNNVISNLAYGTRSENQLDRFSYAGKHKKLSPADVKEIRSRLRNGESHTAIAKAFSVSLTAIGDIKTGRTFAWLT